MIAVRCYDVSIIYGILRNETIWDSICEDTITDYIPDVVKEVWVLMIAEKAVIGVYRIHQTSMVAWQIHAFILPQYRNEHSKESATCVLKWILENIPDLQKLIAIVPKRYKNVYKFCKNTGFKDEGFNRDSFMKNGKVWGQHYLGMTRSEIIDSLED